MKIGSKMTRLQSLSILLILTVIFYQMIIKYTVKPEPFTACHGHKLLKEYEINHKMIYGNTYHNVK